MRINANAPAMELLIITLLAATLTIMQPSTFAVPSKTTTSFPNNVGILSTEYKVCTYVNPNNIGKYFLLNGVRQYDGGVTVITLGITYQLQAVESSGWVFRKWTQARGVHVADLNARSTTVYFSSDPDPACVGNLTANYMTSEYAGGATWYRWDQPTRYQIVVVLYGGTEGCTGGSPGVYVGGYDNTASDPGGARPENEKDWVRELYNYGFAVATLRFATYFPGSGGTWVVSYTSYLKSQGYSKVSLFGHSAGGLVVAYESIYRQAGTYSSTDFVSAPVNQVSCPYPLYTTAQQAANIKTNVGIEAGTLDGGGAWYQQMSLYASNAQKALPTWHAQLYSYTGNLHDNFYNANGQVMRNYAKSWLKNMAS